MLKLAAYIGLAVVFLWFSVGGISHFTNPEFFLAIMPPYIPWHLPIVYVSGALEVVFALMLLPPAIRQIAGNLLIALTLAVTPANIHMWLNPDLFPDITLASRRKFKCDEIADAVKQRLGVTIKTAEVDAMDVAATVALIKETGAELLVNLALPYQDLALMDACLEAGINYLDTANYERPEKAEFEYSWQWAYQERFKEAGLTAILGSGFDPGVTSIFATWLRKHKLDTIRQIDVLDCNGGDHGKPFATNFNPEINIREVTAPARHWENGDWITSPAMTT